VASLLDAPFLDLDHQIVADAGRSIPEIFATEGESGFREHERQAMRRALGGEPSVIAAGGGWIAHAGNLVEAENAALILYMSLDPADAAQRIAGQGGRPLLEGRDPVAALEKLLAERARWYGLAGVEVAVGKAPPDAAAESIALAARQYGGW
jgi:shikimate kinase